MTGVIRIHNEALVQTDIQEVQHALESHRLRLLSLRGCQLTDKQFWMVARALGKTRSLLQLGLNLGVLQGQIRVNMLAQALHTNRSITALLLHGSDFGARGMVVLGPALAMHPSIVTLDLGSCDLTDEAVMHVVPLLHRQGAKLGVKDLTLSFNTKITSAGWTQFALGMASSSELEQLALDHTALGDEAFRCMVVAMAACPSLEMLDLEETEITDDGAQILAQMLDMRRSNLKKVVFKGTNVKKVTREKIEGLLKETEDGMTDGSINSETGEAPKFGLLSSAPKFRSNVTSPRSTHDRTPPPMDISQNDDVTMDNDNYLSDGAQTPLETLSNNLKDIEKRLVHIVETKRDSPRSSTASLMSRRSRLSRTRLSLDNPTAAQSDDSGSVILANGDDSDPKEGSDSSKKARAWVPRGRQSIDDALIHAMMAANGTVSRADLARLSKGEIPADLALPPSPTPSTETVQHLRISQVRQDSLGSVHLGDEEDQGKKSPSLPALPMKPGAFKAHADTDLLYH